VDGGEEGVWKGGMFLYDFSRGALWFSWRSGQIRSPLTGGPTFTTERNQPEANYSDRPWKAL